jgi:hypothetical protein
MTRIPVARAYLVVGLLLAPAPTWGQTEEPKPVDATAAGVQAPIPGTDAQPADAGTAVPYRILVERLKAGDRRSRLEHRVRARQTRRTVTPRVRRP